ncbi:MAG: 2-C-methyl-D-erythritol 4-phosphate cytidylyltransferase [Paludibacter sp.]|nr:2-C-methyl-D-erythritol 4-phosphate cytidylyltransferase [Paludibacter sp.]
MTDKSETVIIVAGGKGERMQSSVPKQFIEIKNKPVLMHTIRVFLEYNRKMNIIVVLPENQMDNWRELCKKHAFTATHLLVCGGDTRFQSVKNGLKYAGYDGLIAVHDGVRPLVSIKTIDACFNEADINGTAIPVIDAVESVRQINENGSISVDRSKFKLVQTPQVFKAEILQKAYTQDYTSAFTDDASVVEHDGAKINLVEGNRENIKITSPFDLRIAEVLLD